MTGPKILVLDCEPSSGAVLSLQRILEESMRDWPCAVRTIKLDSDEVRNQSYRLPANGEPELPELIVVSIGLSPDPANRIVSDLQQHLPGIPIIILGDVEQPDTMLALLEQGATDFVTSPFKANDIVPRVKRLLGHEAVRPTVNIKATLGLRNLVGQNKAFIRETTKIPIIARCDATVLITGETGTGKELCARAIHYLSARAKHPFIPINCGAIPADLAENELFGHERGAYTGAAWSQPGIIEEANSGTLFLDEIDCLSPLTQVKLLRFLQDKEYRPLGSAKNRHADVRIIAATNTDIEESVRQGRMRQDLYYRLHVIPFALLPLRERADDIPLLVEHFLSRYSDVLNKRVNGISAGALSRLLVYQWPGNVRELEHVIERAVVMCNAPVLTEGDITLSRFDETDSHCSFQEGKARAVSEFEQHYIKGLLIANRGNITRAAKAANKNRRAFWELIRKHRIDVSVFRQGLMR
jgi:two-component system, NtrC family, response regulator GlrR